MMQVTVLLRTREPDVPPREAKGFVPSLDCPLAVTPSVHFDETRRQWSGRGTWQITQRALGFNLGRREWSTVEEAMAVLERCDPTFAAWPLATGDKGDPATKACAVKFRWATQNSAPAVQEAS